MTGTTSSRRRLIACVAAGTVFAFGAVGCGDDDTASTDTTTTAPATTEPTETTTSEGSDEPLAGTTTVFFVSGEELAEAERPDVASDPESAVAALIAGPDDSEADAGMSTAIPEGTELHGVEINGDEATVDLSSQFQSGGGSLSMQLRVAQVVFTATQFEGIETVTILLDGERVDGIGGEGVPSTDRHREDFEDFSPAG